MLTASRCMLSARVSRRNPLSKPKSVQRSFATHTAQYVTEEGTRRYAERMNKVAAYSFATHPRFNLTLSRVGFGTLRTRASSYDNARAIRHALLSGVNVIDTAPSYSENQAELLVGEALEELIQAGQISRDEVVIMTKFGFISGTDLQDAKIQKSSGRGFMLCRELSDRIWYSISPDYVNFQLQKSLSRLRVKAIDGLLIQSPEIMLPSQEHIEKLNISPSEVKSSFEHLLKPLFAYLEDKVRQGIIRWYGIASDNFTHSDRVQRISLTAALDAALEVSEEHHFAAIEYPLNLFESAAFTETLERGKTLQQLANQFNLMHFPYRTINAAMPTVELFQEYLKKNNLSVTPPSRLVPMQFRLADVIDEPTTPDITQRAKEALDAVVRMEMSYRDMYNKYSKTYPSIPHPNQLTIGHTIISNLPSLNLEHFRAYAADVRANTPRLFESLSMTGDEDIRRWARRYQLTLTNAMKLFSEILAYNRRNEIREVSVQLEKVANDLESNVKFASKAVRAVVSTDSPTSVLVGMRTPSYVTDIVRKEITDMNPLASRDEVVEIFNVGKRMLEKELEKIRRGLQRTEEAITKSKEQASEFTTSSS